MNNYVTLLSKHRNAIMGVAILWVMLFHLHVSFDFIPLQTIKEIGYGGVDMFLFLSGFGLYFACSKDNFNKRQYYKNRFKRILPEFWLVLIVVFVIQMDFSCRSFYSLICRATTLGLWVRGKIPYSLWYISCILMFYAIYPKYYSLFKKYGIIVPWLCIGGGVFLMFSNALFSIFFFNKVNIAGNAIFAYARIPIFFLGSIFGWLAINDVKIALTRSHKLFALATAFVSFIALLEIIKIYSVNILKACSLYFIPFIVVTPILCIVLAIVFSKVCVIDKIFAYIGSFSFELYLCHAFIFKQLDYFIANYGQSFAICIVILLSCISAWMLYQVNKKCIQRIIFVG